MDAAISLPALSILVNGQPLGTAAADALAAVRIQQRLSLPGCCELTLQDSGRALGEEEAEFALGATLKVTVTASEETLFEGDITALEYGSGPAARRELSVRAYDPLHRLRKNRPLRHHAELTLRDLARELLEAAGVATQVELADAGPVWPKLVQHGQSDLALLREVSARCGLFFTLRTGALRFVSLEGDGRTLPLRLGESLLEARVDASTDPACRAVAVLGWNPWRGESHRGQADRARSGRRVGIDAGPDRAHATGLSSLVDAIVQSDAEASVLAQAELDRRVAGEVTLWGIANGDPALRPGVLVRVQGLTAAANGEYVLTAATHTIDRRRGYITEIDTAPPQVQEQPRAAVSTVGVVTDVNDPEALGRVRVSLPSFGGFDSDWLEVLAPAAGAGKGLMALPDRGDRVLVSLSRGDPAQGVVLGGLYGGEPPADTGVVEGRVQRYTLRTSGGQLVQLDDQKGTVKVSNASGTNLQLSPGRARIANSSGSFVELTRDRLRIHANCDLEIAAPGRSITIRGAAIDFETA